MELEDLKNTWKSMVNEIEHISKNDNTDVLINNKYDVQTNIINRFRWGIVIVIAATFLLGTSRLWAFIKMPVWWIVAFCILLTFGAFATALLINKITKINLGEDTQLQVMAQILSIKKFYKNIELYGSSAILVLVIFGVYASPIPYTSGEIVFIILVTVICYFLEYLSYRSNIKKINIMQEWLD